MFKDFQTGLASIGTIIGIVTGTYFIVTESDYYVLGIIIIVVILSLYVIIRINNKHDLRVLNSEIIIDILDIEGKRATHHKRQTIKALRSNLYTYIEDIAIDRNGSFENADVSPGSIIDEQSEEARTLLIASLGKTLSKNERLDRTFRLDFINPYLNDQEYHIIRQTYPMDKCIVRILFPQNRPPKSYRALKKLRNIKKKCPQPSLIIDNNRPSLVWEFSPKSISEDYRIEWEW